MTLHKFEWIIHSFFAFMHNDQNDLLLVFKLIKACMCVVSFNAKLSLEREDTFIPMVQNKTSHPGTERLGNLTKVENCSDGEVTQNHFSWLQIHAFPTLEELPNPLMGHGIPWECKNIWPGEKQPTNSFLSLLNIVWEWGIPGDKQHNLPASPRWGNMFQTFTSCL